jgi:hypothetical protein
MAKKRERERSVNPYCMTYYDIFDLQQLDFNFIPLGQAFIFLPIVFEKHYLNRKRQNYKIYKLLWQIKQRLCSTS